MAKIPAIPSPPNNMSNPFTRAVKECLEYLTGRRGNSTIEYGSINGTEAETLNIIDLCKMGKIKARAYRKAAQNIDASAWTKVAIDTVDFDTKLVVDALTNNRIIPNLSGYYIVMGQVRANAIPDGEAVAVAVYKNGSLKTYGPSVRQGATAAGGTSEPDLIYMNGTTDYLELYAYNTNGSALALDVQTYNNFLSIVGPF